VLASPVRGVVGAVAAALLLASGGAASSEPAGTVPADAVAVELRADPDAPDSGGNSAIPGMWLLAVPVAAAGQWTDRQDVAALRKAGAELVRTDARGRAILPRTRGMTHLCALGSSDAPGPVAVTARCLDLTLVAGRTEQLTFGEAGLRVRS
jgi:hypothetical protein